MNYIFMLALNNVEGFSIRESLPYSAFCDQKGFKKQFSFKKKTIVQEIKRLNPSAKSNANNITVEQLLAKLGPLENAADRTVFANKLREDETDAEGGSCGRIRPVG